jgi:hypothetical protein
MPILDNEWAIEAQRVAHLLDLPWRSAFPKHLLDRIARDDVNQKKNQGENQPEGWEREK